MIKFTYLEKYLLDTRLIVRLNQETSSQFPIKTEVLQGSILGRYLYLIYTSNFPTAYNFTTGASTDDVAILRVDKDPIKVSTNLQNHLNAIYYWTTI